MHGTLGCTILAPAAREYAVLPVGVAIMMPAIDREQIRHRWLPTLTIIYQPLPKQILCKMLHMGSEIRETVTQI